MSFPRLRTVACLAALAAACGGPDSGPRPNVLLVSLDTTRADHCSVLGYERDTTPRLEELAGEAVSFDVAYAPASTTSPSHATMFTGQYPISHGVLRNGLDLAAEHDTLAERLRDAGYRTAAVVSSFVLHSRFGFAQGFAEYDDALPFDEALPRRDERTSYKGEPIEEAFDRQARFATDRALDWLDDRQAEAPFFLFVHYMDPHNRVDPPRAWLDRFSDRGGERDEVNRYDAMVALTDHHVGRLLEGLDELGLRERTLVIVTADHGEGLMQHGHMGHGVQIYEEAVRVPLLVRWPGRIEGGRRIADPVELTDLAPTVLALVGMDDEPSLQGRSLAPVLLGEARTDPEREVFLLRRPHREGVKDGIAVNGMLHGLRVGRWKYIWGPDEERSELYDLLEDPGETVDRSRDEPERCAAMRARIETWLEGNRARTEAEETTTEEDLQKLRGLGYGH